MQHVILSLLFCFSTALAQDVGKIAGTIRDKETKGSIPGANIVVKGTKLGASTNVDGVYFILNVPPGIYEVTATYVGYQTVTQRQVIVNASRTTTVDFSLSETGVQAGEIVVSATRPDVERDKTSSSTVVRSEEVINTPGVQDLTDVLALSADVGEGHFRGGREGEELYNLSGVSIVNPLDNSTGFVPMVSAIEEVEVITSGFSAQYGNAQSGVVNINMKEGGSDRWRSRLEMRTRLPGYKHFGPSLFDQKAQPYLQFLDTWEKWAGTDTSSGTSGGKYYSSVGNGFDNRFGRDSVTLAQIAHALWMYQGRRDLNLEYDNLRDYSVDMNIGGPLSPDTRLFLATKVENTWLFLPTTDPNTRHQIMGNITHDIGEGKSLRVSGAYYQRRDNLLRSLSTNGFFQWAWDRNLGISYRLEKNIQLGARFSHVISPATFYEVKLSGFSTRKTDGAPVMDSTRYPGDYSKLMWYPYTNTPDHFNVGNRDNDFRDQKTQTLSLDASITSQVTPSHMLLGGFQANIYNIDVYNKDNISSTQIDQIYAAKPMEFALFAQDKMEFQGMIANIGLRLDIWNQNIDYYNDLFSPFRVRVDSVTVIYDKVQAEKAKTPTLARLQPRIGISFPISLSTVFHMNYGSFVQRPSFQYTVSTQIPAIGFARMQLGNPRLQPEETNSYDVGVTQGLGDGFTVDVSGYYKDVRNLIERAYFFDNQQAQYSTFVNRDYADIRGFKLSIAKRRGPITGSANYSYGVATGKSSTPFNASPIYNETPAIGQPAEILPGPKDILLDFDRTHSVVLNIGVNTDEQWGPQVFGIYPLEDLAIAAVSTAKSGRPYTYDTQGIGIVHNKRTPAEYETKLKISKKVRKFFGLNTTFYMEVSNLFNQRIYAYNTVFLSSTAATGTTFINRNVEKYETNRPSLQYYDEFFPFLVDQTFMLYSNQPRSINVGFVMNL